MRLTPSRPAGLTLSAFVITLLYALNASAVTEKTLHNFNPYAGGYMVNPGLAIDAAGSLYGMTTEGGAQGYGAVYKLAPKSGGGWTETVLYSFTGNADGGYPLGGLIFDQAGNLYGATSSSVFELAPSSSGTWTETTLAPSSRLSFGTGYVGNLTFDGAGNLYGASVSGGNSQCYLVGCGFIFKLAPANGSWTLSTIYTFTGGSTSSSPIGGLILDQAGNLYGIATGDGSVGNCTSDQFGCGAVFELTPNGNSWAENILYDFPAGEYSESPLIFGRGGHLFGTTILGGNSNCLGGCGAVFEMTPNKASWTLNPIYQFTGGTDGYAPAGRVAFDSAGNLYGTASTGGSGQCGTVFRLRPSSGVWTENVLYSFKGLNDGCGLSDVLLSSSGSIFGVAGGGPGQFGLVFELSPAKGLWNKSTLASFIGTDGANPASGLILDSSGNLYGETYDGGVAGGGTIFKVTPGTRGGTENLLYAFKGFNNGYLSGTNPQFGLVFDSQGNLYGVAGGGPETFGVCSDSNFCGVVFQLTPSSTGWAQSVIHTFSFSDGQISNVSPSGFSEGPLVSDAAGNFYGTTDEGGAFGNGTVFELTPSGNGTWTETVLYSFTGSTDGNSPTGVVFDQAGNLYGATAFGGATDCGVVFKLAPSSGGGWTESVLYTFPATPNCNDGKLQGPLAMDAAGNLYGATTESFYGSVPIVYQLSPSGNSWTLNVLPGTHAYTYSPLILDAAGNLYGTSVGLNLPYGTVFELSPGAGGWTQTILYTFKGSDGASPIGPLVRDAAGNLYGNTLGGGTHGAGVVFEITP